MKEARVHKGEVRKSVSAETVSNANYRTLEVGAEGVDHLEEVAGEIKPVC